MNLPKGTGQTVKVAVLTQGGSSILGIILLIKPTHALMNDGELRTVITLSTCHLNRVLSIGSEVNTLDELSLDRNIVIVALTHCGGADHP